MRGGLGCRTEFPWLQSHPSGPSSFSHLFWDVSCAAVSSQVSVIVVAGC